MTFDRNLLPDTVTYFEGQGLTFKGPRSEKWKTTACNFHGGSDSMRIHIASGAWVCMACSAKGGDVLAYEMQVNGSDFVEAAKTLGAWIEDGRRPIQHKPTPLSPRQALSVIRVEATLVAIAAGNLANGVILADMDRARLMLAANRINRLTEAFQ